MPEKVYNFDKDFAALFLFSSMDNRKRAIKCMRGQLKKAEMLVRGEKEEIGLALVNLSHLSTVLSLKEPARAGEKDSYFQIGALPAGTAPSF